MNNKKTYHKTKYLRWFLSFVLIIMFAWPDNAFAEEGDMKVEVDVSIEMGGTSLIEGSEYVPPQDPSENAYGEGWNHINGSELLPEGDVKLTLSSGEIGTYTWNISPDDVKPGDMFTYKITQVKGTDPKIEYDQKEFIVEIFIHYDEASGRKSVTAQIRDDGDPKHKPENCAFVNKAVEETETDETEKDSPVPPTPIHGETWGRLGERQNSFPSFKEGSSPIVSIKVLDPRTGEPTEDRTVDALDKSGNKIGTYTYNEDGTVTFIPYPDFVGDPEPLRVMATDANGFTAIAIYQPHVIPEPETLPEETGKDAQKPGRSTQTGDDFDPVPYIVAIAAATVLLVLLLFLKKRKNKDSVNNDPSETEE